MKPGTEHTLYAPRPEMIEHLAPGQIDWELPAFCLVVVGAALVPAPRSVDAPAPPSERLDAVRELVLV